MIENYCFGSFMIDGKEYTYDLKIVEGNIIPWRYTKHHTILMADLKELLEAKPEIIVMGTGAYGAVRVPDDVKRALEAKNVKFVIKATEEACEEYNDALNQNKRVAAILHITC